MLINGFLNIFTSKISGSKTQNYQKIVWYSGHVYWITAWKWLKKFCKNFLIKPKLKILWKGSNYFLIIRCHLNHLENHKQFLIDYFLQFKIGNHMHF